MTYPNLKSPGATNFGNLGTEALSFWSRDFWALARNRSFIGSQFTGKGSNSVVQRVTDLTKTKKGVRAVITLVNDLTGDGVMGDTQLEGNEEALGASQVDITIDQLRNATRSDGKLDEQKQIINFREESRDKLSYWAGDRIDQIAFLSMSGIPLTQTCNGATRPVETTGYNLNDLEFASDISAPSSERHLAFTSSGLVTAAATSATVTNDVLEKPSYSMLVRLKAFAKDNYIRGIRGKGNDETFHVFMTPQGMASLKLDPDFIANVRHAGVRGNKNELFAGSNSLLVDGMYIHEFRHVYSSERAADGAKLGEGGAQDGQRVLFCGAQSLALADLGSAEWNEDNFDYGNQQGIAVAKMLGFRKPKFKNIYSADSSVAQDFGVVSLDTAI